MIKNIIKKKILSSYNSLSKNIELKIEDIDISQPKQILHGDYATNLCMKFSSSIQLNPMTFAEELSKKIINDHGEFFNNVDFVKPGFINFKVKESVLNDCLLKIYKNKNIYGSGDKKKKKILVEFVSANPTGLLHLGHLRNAAVGDSLSRILRFYGYDVQSEYYINDFGNQIKNLGESLKIRIKNINGESLKISEDGYHGEYLIDVANQFINNKKNYKLDDEDVLQDFAKDYLLAEIKKDLNQININFDNWFSEKNCIHSNGNLDKALELLRKLDLLYEKDGALWIKTSQHGDVDDWVLVKSDKNPTYFLSDIAYHLDKISRGFDRIINIWGADHHSHVTRLTSSIKGINDEDSLKLEFVMIQFVRLLKNGLDISMSKRSGQYTTIRDLLSLVDKDVIRFMMVSRSSDTHFDFDLDNCLKDSDENPVFYIQYANARINSILKKGCSIDLNDIETVFLEDIKELSLIKKIIDFEYVIEDSAKNLSPHKLAFYLQDLAKDFHSYYKTTKILNNEINETKIKLILISTIKSVLSTGLGLLGVSSPEEM